MKLKLNGFLVLFVVLVTQITFAQERAVSGVVSDNAGMPLPGVSVLVKGTKTGTQTDFDGKFSIKAAPSQVLIFSFIGMKTQEMLASSSNLNVKLKDNSVELESVIVTAQGIKKEKRALGYAVSEVKAKDLEQRPDGDIARVLTGKASGVSIIAQNGMSGSSTNVVIRGFTSFSGSNQALFIVDGVPFSSDTNSAGRGGDRHQRPEARAAEAAAKPPVDRTGGAHGRPGRLGHRCRDRHLGPRGALVGRAARHPRLRPRTLTSAGDEPELVPLAFARGPQPGPGRGLCARHAVRSRIAAGHDPGAAARCPGDR